MAVGGIDTESLNTAAHLGALGLDPILFLSTKDGLLRSLMVELGNRMAEIHKMMDRSLAVEIANNVGKLFPK